MQIDDYRPESTFRPGQTAGGGAVVTTGLLVIHWALWAAALLGSIHFTDSPALKHYLGMTAQQVLRDFWAWQLLTYAFLHDNAFLLILNTVLLILVGAPLERRWGSRRVLGLYLFSALMGGVLSCLLAERGEAFGASGAVMGLVLAAAVLYPEGTTFGILRARHVCWLALLAEVIACLFLLDEQTDRGIRRMPHALLVFGGLAGAWMFLRTEPGIRRFTGLWMRRREIRRKREMAQIRQQVDELLEKIKNFGMANLSRKEREFLDRASELFR